MSALHLSYPPTSDRLWQVEAGRIVRSVAYREWLALARAAIRASAHPAVLGRFVLNITAHRPESEGGERDLDSLLSPLTAALTAAGLVGDDSLADRIVVRWSRQSKPGGQLEVEARSA
jgi:Holliday junction resolvase RusA-like endonuclease